jgi:hypothetical protein
MDFTTVIKYLLHYQTMVSLFPRQNTIAALIILQLTLSCRARCGRGFGVTCVATLQPSGSRLRNFPGANPDFIRTGVRLHT